MLRLTVERPTDNRLRADNAACSPKHIREFDVHRPAGGEDRGHPLASRDFWSVAGRHGDLRK
jgi:hypothetical protein